MGIKEAEQFADEDKKVKERVDAKNSFDGYIHAMRSATEGSGENKGLSEKMESEEKEQILDALKDGHGSTQTPRQMQRRSRKSTRRLRAFALLLFPSTTTLAVVAAAVVPMRMRRRRMMSSRPTYRVKILQQ